MKKSFGGKEAKELIETLNMKFGMAISKKDKIEREDTLLLINNVPMFFFHEEKIYPTLKSLLKNNFLKKITVDMGAIRFVASGADIMRPGIVKFDEAIKKEDPVSIIDATHSKPLAVGIALFSSEELAVMTSGKVIKNIHFVGDKIWEKL
jgi:PUA-domain protein